MTTTLLLRFPFGRYHANPWARHVNEGAVEIPPSPWRLLRALYAVWQTRVPELDPDAVHALLATLAIPPTFHVPRHAVAHTRHYYPDSRNGTDRTLDTFAVLSPDAELAAQWPGELAANQHATLERLAASMPYLGRADSLCEARVTGSWAPTDHETWVPLDTADSVARESTGTAVLAPQIPLQIETLLARPVDVRRGGLLFPAGSRFVGYQRTAPVAPLPVIRPAAPESTAVRFDVLQAAFPPETDTVVFADMLRRAALSKLGADRTGRPRTLLGGRTATDEKMQDQHQHAHYLPVLRDRRLFGLVVWVPAGLPDRELEAVTRVRRLSSSWQKERLDIRVSGYGPVADTAADLAGPARSWQSVTPFVPSRYPKRSDGGLAYLEREIEAELDHRGLPAPSSIIVVAGRDTREFVRHRPSRPSSRVNRPASFLHLTFAEPVAGPIALGHLSHFGLGLFEPVPER